jgi:SARP family transcriptional regulator, regulator of embCAB operon
MEGCPGVLSNARADHAREPGPAAGPMTGPAPAPKADPAADGPAPRAAQFQLLGPVGISDGETLAVLQPSKPATLLAVLMLYPNTVVSIDALLRAVWDDEPPATAKAALHTCVLRLRRLFAKHGMAGTDIEAMPGGYRIAARPETLDLLRFRELARQADAEPEPGASLALLRAALALWRGPALGNVPSGVVHREEVPRLDEEQLRVVERVFDLEVALGHRREVLPELLSAARTHPGHERFREQLIEALYRTGRRGEALNEYRRVKRYLRDELGVDPGPALKRLELQVLRGEDPQEGARELPGGEARDGEVRPVTGAQILDRLLSTGLLTKRPDGYLMHELLYVLTRDAAVFGSGRREMRETPAGRSGPRGPRGRTAEPATRRLPTPQPRPGKDDVV